MASNVVGILLLSVLMVFFLPQESQAGNIHSPAPSIPQPGGNTTAPAPVNLPMYGVTPGSLQPQGKNSQVQLILEKLFKCAGRCTTRCSNTAYKKPCLFFCQKCCATCLCVPPGTYGNKELCPCYENWKTKRGGPKCP